MVDANDKMIWFVKAYDGCYTAATVVVCCMFVHSSRKRPGGLQRTVKSREREKDGVLDE